MPEQPDRRRISTNRSHVGFDALRHWLEVVMALVLSEYGPGAQAPLCQLVRVTEKIMVKVGLLVQLQAKPGKEGVVAKFLADALTLANQETGTLVWFALQTGPSTFAIFDAFADDAGRKTHLAGPIAAALMANASELLSQPPKIEQVDVLAAKVPK
jgi:quinol monooxygenase YgiN